jgi:hypothetical protein
MSRPISKVAPEWWDYTTLDPESCVTSPELTRRGLRAGTSFTCGVPPANYHNRTSDLQLKLISILGLGQDQSEVSLMLDSTRR